MQVSSAVSAATLVDADTLRVVTDVEVSRLFSLELQQLLGDLTRATNGQVARLLLTRDVVRFLRGSLTVDLNACAVSKTDICATGYRVVALAVPRFAVQLSNHQNRGLIADLIIQAVMFSGGQEPAEVNPYLPEPVPQPVNVLVTVAEATRQFAPDEVLLVERQGRLAMFMPASLLTRV